MKSTTYIAIIGEYSSHVLDNTIQGLLTSNVEAEINVFDFPIVGGIDTVVCDDKRVYVHKYNCPSQNLADSVIRNKEYVRDIIALGAIKYYIYKPKEKEYRALYESIEAALKIYGVNYQIL